MPIRRSQKKRNAEPRQKQNHRRLVIDTMVNPGSSAHRHQARSKADPARPHHRMVTLAQSSPGDRSACAPQSKTATVMLRGGYRMRISYLLGFLLALSLPAAAAEPDQNLKQEIGKVASAYEQNFNKKDAAGITSLYTKNYLRVNAGGVVTDNTKLYEGIFKTGFDHLEVKTTEIQPLSDDTAMATGESRITGMSEK